VVPGDTLVLHDLLVLLVVSRRPTWFLERRHASGDGSGVRRPGRARDRRREPGGLGPAREPRLRGPVPRARARACGESGAGKGARGARCPHTVFPARAAVRDAQRGDASGGARRRGAVRERPRLPVRRHERAARPHRRGGRRHAVPRRDRGDAARPPGPPAASHGSRRRIPAARGGAPPARRHSPRGGDQPAPRRRSSTTSPRASPSACASPA
jgi:hypothetical protein